MDNLNLAPTVSQNSWLLNLFCDILYSFLLFISIYLFVKVNYYLLIEGFKNWKKVFRAMKEFYSGLSMRDVKLFFSGLGHMTYCFYMCFFYLLIAPFHAFYLLCTGQYPGNRQVFGQ